MYTPGTYLLYKEHMNLRTEPSVHAKSLGILPQGMTIEVKEVSDNWGKVEGEHISGWCCISECFAKKCCPNETYCDTCPRCAELEEKCRKLENRLRRIRGILQ